MRGAVYGPSDDFGSYEMAVALAHLRARYIRRHVSRRHDLAAGSDRRGLAALNYCGEHARGYICRALFRFDCAKAIYFKWNVATRDMGRISRLCCIRASGSRDDAWRCPTMNNP